MSTIEYSDIAEGIFAIVVCKKDENYPEGVKQVNVMATEEDTASICQFLDTNGIDWHLCLGDWRIIY